MTSLRGELSSASRPQRRGWSWCTQICGALLFLLLAVPARAEISIAAPRFVIAGRDLQVEATVSGVPANRKLRIFVLLDGKQVRTVDLGNGVHALRFEALQPAAGRHEIAFQVGRDRAVDTLRVVPWWGAASAVVLPAALALLGIELARKARRRRASSGS